MSLLPRMMFRAKDKENNRGNLFVLKHKFGPDGKLYWRPDSQGLPAKDEYFDNVREQWEMSKLAKELDRYKEIPIDDDAQLLQIVHVSMNAGPSLRTD